LTSQKENAAIETAIVVEIAAVREEAKAKLIEVRKTRKRIKITQ
jgi:hypothetical protein